MNGNHIIANNAAKIAKKALKNDTTLKFEDKEPNELKSYFEINFATIIRPADEIKEKKELKINWNEEADQIIAKINAFNPSPGCWFNLSGLRIKVLTAKEVEASGKPGTIVDQNLTIACSKNAIKST